MRYLKNGRHGPDVEHLQGELNALAFMAYPGDGDRELDEDGKFGPLTEGWTKKFQQSAQVKIDGIVGPVTWSMIDHHRAVNRNEVVQGINGETRQDVPNETHHDVTKGDPKSNGPTRSPDGAGAEPSPTPAPPRAAAVPKDKQSFGPRIVASGSAALEEVRSILPMLEPIKSTSGQVLIPAGTVDKKAQAFIVGKLGQTVFYLRKNNLYGVPLRQFRRGAELSSVTSGVLDSTRWIKPVGDRSAEMLLGIAYGILGTAGTALAVGILVLRVSNFAYGYYPQLVACKGDWTELGECEDWFRAKAPMLSSFIDTIKSDKSEYKLRDALSLKTFAQTIGQIIGLLASGSMQTAALQFTVTRVAGLVLGTGGRGAMEVLTKDLARFDPESLKKSFLADAEKLGEKELNALKLELNSAAVQSQLSLYIRTWLSFGDRADKLAKAYAGVPVEF
ncbi:MAG: peptidoglycan-binding domain-containing protein [Pseudomonadota bacterium]